MSSKRVLHMNAGDGETSYANNSGHQKTAMSKSLSVLDETLNDMFNDYIHDAFPKCLKIVDLGCASGPNTLSAMSHIMDTIGDLCKQKNIINENLPEFEVFLNDLADNDFNSLFKSLPERNGRYFVYGLPGSFYDRLFPRKSIHFAYSSYCLHWLSQVPEGLESINKENVYMAMTSSPEVYEAYAKQYESDFNKFLSSRAAELIPGGRMVLIFVGRSVEDLSTKDDSPVFVVLAKTLAQMVHEGLVKMDDLYSFNLPMYAPCVQEVEKAIRSEGSFTLDKFESFRVRLDIDDHRDALTDHNYKRGKMVSDCIRGFLEPVLASHFGSSIMDDLFKRYEKDFADHLSTEDDASSFNFVISLTRNLKQNNCEEII